MFQQCGKEGVCLSEMSGQPAIYIEAVQKRGPQEQAKK